MFAGMDGDTAAFDRAMKLIADTLAREPDDACLARGPLFMAGQAFQRGDCRLLAEALPEGWPTWSGREPWHPSDIGVRAWPWPYAARVAPR